MNGSPKRIKRADLLAFLGSAIALAACSSNGTPIVPNRQIAASLAKFGIRITKTAQFPAPRPDGSIPPLKRGADPHADVIQPCYTNCDPGGGGGGTTSPSYTTSFDGAVGDCYATTNYCEYYDNYGNLQSQTYLTQNSDNTTTYKYVGANNTVTGTQPNSFSIPNDTDYSYLGWTLHAISSTGIVSVTDPSTGNVAYVHVDSSYNLVISSPNQPTMTASLTSMGYHTDLWGISSSCVWAVAKAAGVSVIAAAIAVAIVLGLCGIDGPAAPFTCGFGWLVAGAIVERASRAAKDIAAAGGC